MGRALNQQNHRSSCDALLQRYCSFVYSVLQAADAGPPMEVAAGATAIIMGHTGVVVGITEPSWATIPGKTMSSVTDRISTVLQERATSVVSAAVVSTAVASMAVAVAGTAAD